jgi:signal transduction histidine kinase
MAFIERVLAKLDASKGLQPLSRRPESTGLEFEMVDLDEFISEVVESMRPMAEQKGLRLLTSLRTETFIRVAPPQMVMALQNVIENGIEATAAGRVMVMAHRIGDRIVIEVEDTGPGIPEVLISVLFAPYASFDKPGGNGLSLAGAKAVVERHGGTISAKNTSCGARFTIHLPL